MMFVNKLDESYKGRKGKKREDEFKINLRFYTYHEVEIDVQITPLYCMNCQTQLDGFFILDGSRYGQVGSVICDHCGAEIFCGDDDSNVDRLKTYTQGNNIQLGSNEGSLLLNYDSLYKLDRKIWNAIKVKIGYDVIGRYREFRFEDAVDEYNKNAEVPISRQTADKECTRKFFNPSDSIPIAEAIHKIIESNSTDTKYISLQYIIDEICREYSINLDNVKINPALLDTRIKNFPKVINGWFALLTILDIKVD